MRISDWSSDVCSSDLAALDGALEKQMAPMITHLGSIQQGIDTSSGGGAEGVRDAIASSAGAAMAGLAEAIGAMTVSMATMSERLEKQTDEADRSEERRGGTREGRLWLQQVVAGH